jgi:hypothetical protein
METKTKNAQNKERITTQYGQPRPDFSHCLYRSRDRINWHAVLA